MNDFVKLDVAIELLADKISKTSTNFFETNEQTYKNELDTLMVERNKIYGGDIDTIDKVISTYGEELKFEFRGKKFEV